MYRAQGEGRELSPKIPGGAMEMRVLGALPSCLLAGAVLPGHSFSSPSLGAGLSCPGCAHSVSQALSSPHSLIPGTSVLRARPFVQTPTAAFCQAESQPWVSSAPYL